jgi:hypothetical protein
MNEIEARKIDKARRLKSKPIRICRWLNECNICEKDIKDGQKYYDGGSRLRGHVECVEEYEGRRVLVTE